MSKKQSHPPGFPPDKPFCYGLLSSELADPSRKSVTPIMVIEGETGYYPTNWSWRRDTAEAARDQVNAALGVSRQQADQMMMASMRPPPNRPHRFAYFFREHPGVHAELTKLGIDFIELNAGDEDGIWPAFRLPSGAVIAFARDDEGNGPGALHIFTKDDLK